MSIKFRGTALAASRAVPRTTVAVAAALACAAVAGAVPATADAGVTALAAVRPLAPLHHVQGSRLLRVQGPAAGLQTLSLRGDRRISPGDIVAVTPGGAAPFGLLRHVLSTQHVGDRTVIRTDPAQLSEALPPGHYATIVSLRPQGAAAPSPGSRAVRPALSLSGKTFTLPISKAVSCSGSAKTLTITGGLTVAPTVNIAFDVGPTGVNSATASLSLTEDATLKASIDGAASCSFKQLVGVIPLPAAAIGPVPIVPTISISLDATAGVQAALSVSASAHQQGTVGLSYDRANGLRGINTFATPQFSFTHSAVQASGKIEAGYTVSLAVLVGGVIGPRVDGRQYVGLSANSAPSLTWRLYHGVAVNGGLKILVFDLGTWSIWKHEWTLATWPQVAWHTIRHADGSWQRAGRVDLAAHIPGTIVAIAETSTSPGVVQYLVATSDGRLWHTIRNADGSWVAAGDAAGAAQIPGRAVAVAATSSAPGLAQFLVVTSDGRLWHTIRNVDGSWVPAGDAAGAAHIPGAVAAVAAASTSPGTAQFAVVTTDGRLWHTIRYADGNWQPAGDAARAAGIPGAVDAVAAVASSPGVAQFAVVTNDGRLWHTIRYADGSWQRAGNAAAVARISGSVEAVAAASTSAGTAQYLVVTSDGRVWHTLRNADGSWTTAGDAEAAAQITGFARTVAGAGAQDGNAQFVIAA